MRNNRFSTLKDVLDDMIQEMRIGTKLQEMHIRKYWNREMGIYITKNTKTMYFKDGVLYVYVNSAALKQELFLAREKIGKLLNEKIGSSLIREVVIR
jgi:predicted nucleic acid-binding Zn ribbon protein